MKELFTKKIKEMTKTERIVYCVCANLLMFAAVAAVYCTKQCINAETITLGENLFQAVCFAAPIAVFFDGIVGFSLNGEEEACR